MSLKMKLKKLKEVSYKDIPKDMKDTFEQEAEKLAQEKIEEQALKVGDKIPSFTIKNAVGEIIDSNELLAQGPLVINFYRGGW